MTLDNTTGTMYGCSSWGVAAGETSIHIIDVTDGSYTLVGTQSTARAIGCIAVDVDGQMYGINLEANAKLYAIDKTDGSVTLIGGIGQGAAGMGHAMDYNFSDSTMYLSTYNSVTFQNTLRIVDLTNGSTTEVGDVGEWTGLFAVTPSLIADFEASDTSVCLGGTVSFTDLSEGAISWSWVFEGGTPATSTDQNPTVTYNTVGEYDVELTVNGIEAETKINYISVVVLPVQANTPEGDTGVCLNNSYDYTTDEVNYASGYDWEVSPADAGTLTGDGNTANLVTSEDWTGDFTIRVRATNVCGDGDWSDYLECSLSEAPEVFLLSEGGEYCNGDETGIEITQDNSTEGIDYELFLDDVTTGTIVEGTGSEISYGFFTDEGNYTATGTEGGCSSYMEGTAVITIAYEPDPTTVPTGDTTVCSGTTTDYSVAPIPGADTIYWSLTPSEAGTVIGGGEEISIEWDIDFSGYAYLSAQGENTCGLGDESDDLEINCTQSPSPEIMGSDMVCKEEEADYSTSENAGNTYEWTVTGGTISAGEGTYQITVLWGAPGNGTVDLIESIEGGCSGSSETLEVTIDDCIGIDEALESNLSVYPNPATDVINIQSESVIRTIKLMDLTGKEIVTESNFSKTYLMNTSNLKPGVYLLVIEMEKTIVKRVIIE